jgi:PTS system arbutin-like IIC component
MGIASLQEFMLISGPLGVWVYTFLERILIPTGLHHFIYGPFIFGPAAVEGGIQLYWAQHLQEFSQSTRPLIEQFPQGGFALHGNSKIFGAMGIALAIYATAAKENKAKVAGLLIPATLTAMLVGITEPLEFTFLCCLPSTPCWPPPWPPSCTCSVSSATWAAACSTSSCRRTGSPCSTTMPA